jgi:hypothetical protein
MMFPVILHWFEIFHLLHVIDMNKYSNLSPINLSGFSIIYNYNGGCTEQSGVRVAAGGGRQQHHKIAWCVVPTMSKDCAA